MYYLATDFESIHSLLIQGRVQSRGSSLYCTSNPLDSLEQYTQPYDQLFLLELKISVAEPTDHLILDRINPRDVVCIYVHSEQARDVLQSMFQGRCPKKIVVETSIYLKTKDRPASVSLSAIPAAKKQKNEQIGSSVPLGYPERLSSYSEHFQFMQKALLRARSTVLITSYDINYETIIRAQLHEIIPMLRQRGVKIYIYYNDQKDLDRRVIKFFQENSVFIQEAFTHSKLLAIDHSIAAVGSFNWLSSSDARFSESDEGTLVCRRDYCSEIIDEFWRYIKYYRHRQFGNDAAVERFERNIQNDSTCIWELDDGTELGLIPTLNQHCGFFQDCFEAARNRLIICSPFISSEGEYEDDIDLQLLRETVQRGVTIYFVCSSNSGAIDSFRAFLAELSSPKIHLITANNIHLKTIIVDNTLISEGSFNWLSAMRDDESDYHNHEQTFYVRGQASKKLIDQFYTTRVGKMICEVVDIESYVLSQDSPFKPVQASLSEGSASSILKSSLGFTQK